MQPRLGSVVVLGSLLACAGGAAWMAYGRWSHPLVIAADAMAHRDPALALATYDLGENRFRRFSAARWVLRGDYARLTYNQLALLYRTGQYDLVIEKAGSAPAGADSHFWAGCALFAKSAEEETAEARLAWLSRAEDAFKRALARTPDDWDAKYNYELSARLAASLRREPQKGPSLVMPLLRPQPKAGRQPVKKVG